MRSKVFVKTALGLPLTVAHLFLEYGRCTVGRFTAGLNDVNSARPCLTAGVLGCAILRGWAAASLAGSSQRQGYRIKGGARAERRKERVQNDIPAPFGLRELRGSYRVVGVRGLAARPHRSAPRASLSYCAVCARKLHPEGHL